MSFVGRQESCVLEDPNAVRHMDALFDVLRKPSGNASSVVGGGSATCSAAAADLVHGGPGDVEFFLDALFSVVQHPTGGGERRATSSREKKQAAAKTWKERELPASFFNSGGSTDDCDKSTRDRGDGDRTQEKACQNEAPNSPQPRPPSSETKPQEITSPAGDRSGGVAPPLPVVLVANTNTTESLTFYIDKHLHCRVNMEPAVERRRRLARGRVQKYRTMKKRRRQRKGGLDAPDSPE